MTPPSASSPAAPPSPDPAVRPPLEGILVVSLEQAVAAPLATARLADAGARVIKVERPEGDFARGYDRAAGATSSYFAWANRGKESIALDLRDPADREVMDRLVARADVFVQNLAVGAAARLGYDATTLRSARPELVVCDISGFGPDGPAATRKAYDLLVQAESGLVSVSGGPGEPGRVGVSVVDIGTGLNAAAAVLEALLRRERTGEGAHVEVSLFDSIAEWMAVPLLHLEGLGVAPARVGLAHPSIAPYGAFRTADGATVVLSVQSDREWRDLVTEVLGRPELADDERFASNVARVEHRVRTDAAVAEVLGRLDVDAAMAALDGARIAAARLNDVAGLATHPHLRRIAVDVGGAEVQLPAPPTRAPWSPVELAEGVAAAVPGLDQHGAAIRSEVGLG